MQVPPMVSALKVDGRRLHELAREGIEVERAAAAGDGAPLRRRRRPTIRWCCAIEVRCSSGTYVRTLAADLGRLLGGGAHLRRLRRTACGSFAEPSRRGRDELRAARRRRRRCATTRRCAVERRRRRAGAPRPGARSRAARARATGPWAVLDRDGELLAMYERSRPTRAKPAVVIPS